MLKVHYTRVGSFAIFKNIQLQKKQLGLLAKNPFILVPVTTVDNRFRLLTTDAKASLRRKCHGKDGKLSMF